MAEVGAVWDMLKKSVVGADGGFNAENFARHLILNAVAESGVSGKAVARIATKAIVKEQAGFFQFLGRYINSRQPAGPLGIPWLPLTPAYLSRRKKRGKGFFNYKGHLGRNLISKNGALLGDPVVSVKKGEPTSAKTTRGREVLLPTFDITIDLFQALGKTFDLATIETRFASKRLITPLSKRKLIGRSDYHRPLLAPALEYYRNRIGAAVLEAVAKAGYEVEGQAHKPDPVKKGRKTRTKKVASSKPKIIRGKALDPTSDFIVEVESFEDKNKRLRRLRLKQSISDKLK